MTTRRSSFKRMSDRQSRAMLTSKIDALSAAHTMTTTTNLRKSIKKSKKQISRASLASRSDREIQEEHRFDEEIGESPVHISKKVRFTPDEDSKLTELISLYGKKWRLISEMIPNSNETRIRNRYYSYIRKNPDSLLARMHAATSQLNQQHNSIESSNSSMILEGHQATLNDGSIEKEESHEENNGDDVDDDQANQRFDFSKFQQLGLKQIQDTNKIMSTEDQRKHDSRDPSDNFSGNSKEAIELTDKRLSVETTMIMPTTYLSTLQQQQPLVQDSRVNLDHLAVQHNQFESIDNLDFQNYHKFSINTHIADDFHGIQEIASPMVDGIWGNCHSIFRPNAFLKREGSDNLFQVEEPSPLLFMRAQGSDKHRLFLNNSTIPFHSFQDEADSAANAGAVVPNHDKVSQREDEIAGRQEEYKLSHQEQMERISFLTSQIEQISFMLDQCKREILKEIILKQQENTNTISNTSQDFQSNSFN